MNAGPLLLVAVLALVAGIVLGVKYPRVWLALTVAGSLAGLGAALCVLMGWGDWEWRSAFTLGGEAVHLRLDAISALFLALVSVVDGAGAVYSHEYWSQRQYPASAPRGRAYYSALIVFMGLVLIASNGLHFLIAWELFTLCAYFLITLERERSEVRSAGWLYLAASHAGTLCLFVFFALLSSRTGSWELGPMREHAELAPLFWLALFGFGIKAGFFPLHIWLPSAHANAPSHVSAILSGVAIKMGIYGIVRFSGWLPMPCGAGWTVAAIGVISALLGVAFALGQHDLKRLLAYHSVENIGIILIGLGFAIVAVQQGCALWGILALAGALLHVWNHGLFKALLFFGAGGVLHATGTREMSRLGGLWRAMPWTAGLFALGAVAISGLPPLNGFVSEWLVYMGLFDASILRGPSAWAAIPAAILLCITGALALACFIKVCGVVFLGAPRSPAAAHAHECGLFMRGPMLLLACLCTAIGLFPIFFWPALARAAACWNPAWTVAQPAAPLATLGSAHVALAVVMLAMAVLLWRKAHKNGLVRGPTWDCGYAEPTPRMQYTSASFAGIITGWFRWILLPERKIHRPHGYFPADAIHLEHVPETVLERVVEPVAGVIMHVSTAVRRLQHGHLQFYILYLVLGLIALGVLVFLGRAL
jgi:hydrogenase-4 component B